MATHFKILNGSLKEFILAQPMFFVATAAPDDFVKQRGPEELLPFYADMGPDGVQAYWKRKNRTSINGKPTGI